MVSSIEKLPVYAKLSIIVVGILAFFYILSVGRSILIPLVFSTLMAILLNPLVNFLTSKNINRIVAIFMAVITALLVVAVVVCFVGSQATMFSDSFPEFKQKFSVMSDDVIHWTSETFKISESKIHDWVNKIISQGMANSSAFVGQTLSIIGGMLAFIFLVPVYIFMILFYKPLLLEFISRLFPQDQHGVVVEVLGETKTLVQSYLMGLLLEVAIVATLNSIGLLIIGLDYAILIGTICALLNIIPYIGGLVAVGLSMLMAMATKSPGDALWVLAVFLLVQFIDNNYIVPKIVAHKVKINALISILVVLIGGALWGVAGMFLAIPITAITKVVFDRIEAFTPFGFLLGDNQPDIRKAIFKFKRSRKKSKEKVI